MLQPGPVFPPGLPVPPALIQGIFGPLPPPIAEVPAVLGGMVDAPPAAEAPISQAGGMGELD